MKGQQNALLTIIVIGAIIFFAGGFAPVAIVPGVAPTVVGEAICPNTLGTSVSVEAKNPNNSSLEFIAVDARVTDPADGRTITTLASATTGLGTAGTLECGDTFDFVVLGNVTQVSQKNAGVFVEGQSQEVRMSISEASDVEFKVLDSSFDNQTSGFVQDALTANQTVGQEANTYTIKARVQDAAAQYGSDTLPNYVCADFSESVYSKANGVILSGSGSSAVSVVPRYPASLGFEKCWQIPAIKSTAGEIQWSLTVRGDLADPGAGNDVKVQVFDGNYYLKTDGTIGSGTGNDINAAIGEVDRFITIDTL